MSTKYREDKIVKPFSFNDIGSFNLPSIIENDRVNCSLDKSNYVVVKCSSNSTNFYYLIVPNNHSEQSNIDKELVNSLKSSLKELSLFKKDWDGYDALPFKKDVMSNSYRLLNIIFSRNISLPKNIIDVHIEPETNGVISFFMEYDNPYLRSTTISVGKSKISSYSKYKKKNNSGLMSDLTCNDMDILVNKLNNALLGIYQYQYLK